VPRRRSRRSAGAPRSPAYATTLLNLGAARATPLFKHTFYLGIRKAGEVSGANASSKAAALPRYPKGAGDRAGILDGYAASVGLVARST